MNTKAYIAKQIRTLRTEKAKLSGEELANMLHPVRSSKTISSWETARTQPKADTLLQLSRIFDVPVSHFYPDTVSEQQSYGLGATPERASVEIPLYGSIAAGLPLAVIPVEDTHPVPFEMHTRFPQAFFLRVEGESMNNILPNGSYALIDPEQTEPYDGKIYALFVDEENASIKRIKKLEHGYSLLPDSKDPTFRPLILDYNSDNPSTITIIGRVVWMTLPFDWSL